MKKLFALAVLGVLIAGCSSSDSRKESTAKGTTYTQYQIVDQEFENYVVENDNYDRVAPYEDQVNSSTYIQSSNGHNTKTTKPNKTVVQKTVVDGQGNILSSDAKAPVTDQETLPDGPQAKEAQN